MRVRHARDYNVVVYKVGGQEHVYGPRRYTIEVIQGSDRNTKHQIQKSNWYSLESDMQSVRESQSQSCYSLAYAFKPRTSKRDKAPVA